MRSSGKLVVLSILAIAVIMAGFAWVWNRKATERSVQFWGKDRALIIRDAQQVLIYEVLSLEAKPKVGAGVVIVCRPNSGQFLRQLDNAQDITGAPGLVHARHSLLQDHSFRWGVDVRPAANAPPPRITHAVRFIDTQGTVTILFDFHDKRLYCVENSDCIEMAPKTSSGWLSYVKRSRPYPQPK